MLIEKAIDEVTENLDPGASDTPDLGSEAGPFGVVPDDGLGDS
jgi:hypothetical protein